MLLMSQQGRSYQIDTAVSFCLGEICKHGTPEFIWLATEPKKYKLPPRALDRKPGMLLISAFHSFSAHFNTKNYDGALESFGEQVQQVPL